MSGRWMTAGNRTAVYRNDVPAHGDGKASNFATRAVLRELCATAHHAGIAHVHSASIANRIGISGRHVKRALHRLLADGWIIRPVRGVGNRVGADSRASVYVLRPLPDADGVLWPDPEWIGQQWPAYALTPRFLRLSTAARHDVRLAASNALTSVQQGDSWAQQGDSTVPPKQVKEELDRLARALTPGSPFTDAVEAFKEVPAEIRDALWHHMHARLDGDVNETAKWEAKLIQAAEAAGWDPLSAIRLLDPQHQTADERADERIHPRTAARNRGRLALVAAKPPDSPSWAAGLPWGKEQQ